MVPFNFLGSAPWLRATSTYNDRRMAAVELIVIEVLIFSSGI